jgi:MFS family permease
MANIGFIFSVYSLSKAIVAPIVGKLMAKTGRKVMIYTGLILEVCFFSIIHI